MANDYPTTRMCTSCKAIKPLAGFSFRSGGKYGRKSVCKPCCNARLRKRYADDPEKHQARGRAVHAKFRDRANAASRVYKIEHAKEIKAQRVIYNLIHKAERNAFCRVWYDENREREIARAIAWQQANPEKVFVSVRINNRLRKSRVRAAEGKMTRNEWNDILDYHGHRCAYCLKHKDQCGTLAIEHMMPLARGGTGWPENVVPACRNCNAQKQIRTPMEFLSRLCDRAVNQAS